MKKNIFYVAIVLTFVSCTETSTNEIASEITSESLVIENKTEVAVDNTKEVKDIFEEIRSLEKETIEKLTSSENQDEIILNFINSCNELNQISHCDYLLDEYKNEDESSWFCDDGDIEHYSKEFREFYVLDSEEGNYYSILNPNFIKNTLNSGELSKESKSFVKLYVEELNASSVCLEGLELTMNFEGLLSEALKWGLIYQNSQEKAYFSIVEHHYNYYMNYLLSNNCGGVRFNETSGKFEEGYYKRMKDVIVSNPNNQVTQDFIEFCSLLEKGDFIESEEVSDFTDKFY